jgi:hypothetical protein
MFRASTASSELHRQLSVSGIATLLKDWFYVICSHAEDTKEMAAMYTLGKEYGELRVV